MGTPREILDPAPPAEQDARLRRHYGNENPGLVSLRDFDQGLVETLGAFIEDQRYWLTIPGVDPPPNKPGVLVTFSFPEAEFKAYVVPLVLIRRDDISPAMERWHSYNQTYKAAPQGANPITVDGRQGYDRVEVGYQSIPFDISYTISVLSHYRGALGQRGQVQAILHHVLRTYPPFGELTLLDSIGDPRAYNTFTEGTSVLDDHPEIAERVIGFGVTVRVEAELDLHEPAEGRTAVNRVLTLNLKEL